LPNPKHNRKVNLSGTLALWENIKTLSVHLRMKK